jgi:putative membrane protein
VFLVDLHQGYSPIFGSFVVCAYSEEVRMWWYEYWPMPWMFMGPVVMLIFVVLCITMMFLMMRGMGHRHRRTDPLDVLKERFARGEINQAEYDERRRLLQA